jgi:hypothetical protein
MNELMKEWQSREKTRLEARISAKPALIGGLKNALSPDHVQFACSSDSSEEVSKATVHQK